MKTFSVSEIKALFRKDLLVRWREKFLTATLLGWPMVIFMLLYIIRLKYGFEEKAECQFPTRLLPTKNAVVPSVFSYICSLENNCKSTNPYEEYSTWKEAPLSSVIDIVNIFVTDDRLYNAIVDLPDKANFVSAVTSVITSPHFNVLRGNLSSVINLVPEIERMVNYSFDIKRLFSHRETFVKFGQLLCGHPFPSTESIPLVNDILYSEDFSEINDNELHSMPTKYCKRLYLDVTSTNQGKLTWNTIRPLIQGKILYTPSNDETESIVKFANETFDEVLRLRLLAKSAASILTKLRTNTTFQDAFENLLKLARSPLVQNLVGDDFDIEEIERVFNYVRTNELIYEIMTTVSNLMECILVDRFEAVTGTKSLRTRSYELAQERLFLAAINFTRVEGKKISYSLHMDTDNTQPTFENHNRFWFPGPAGSMLVDLKYHRGFIHVMQVLDLAIIKHKRKLLGPIAVEEELHDVRIPGLKIERVDDGDDDDLDLSLEGSGDADVSVEVDTDDSLTTIKPAADAKSEETTEEVTTEDVTEPITEAVTEPLFHRNKINDTINPDSNTNPENTGFPATVLLANDAPVLAQQPSEDVAQPVTVQRFKRQGLLDLLNSFSSLGPKPLKFEVDDMRFYTKQFPYPAYVNDSFKRGLYLSQAVQLAFCLGLVVVVAICVRERIWMRESRNSMLMRSMGLHAHSEVMSWTLMTFMELCIVFFLISIVLYTGGILAYTNWIFMMFYCLVFGVCLIAFCYMCSNFFTAANIGAVASALLFFITLCPYIIVLMFDAKLNHFQTCIINLSFTTAFSKGWSEIMRMELQQNGFNFAQLVRQGVAQSDTALALVMFVVDTILYVIIGYLYHRFKITDYSFINVSREQLNDKLGASLTDVSKMYGNKMALSHFSMDFARNQVTCLLGRNGAGKSTVIKLLTGQIIQTNGRVLLARSAPGKREENVGVCWQDNILIPNLTPREHLELYVKIKRHRTGADEEEEVRRTLKSLNFGEHENYFSWQLSGGFKRRLCVAIAFIASPSVVILDEPCNGVDAKARKDIWQLIEKLREGRALIFSTHFLDEAKYLSDTIVIMREGRTVAQHNRDSVQRICTAEFTVAMSCDEPEAFKAITDQAQTLLRNSHLLPAKPPHNLLISASYDEYVTPGTVKFLEFVQGKEAIKAITNLAMSSPDLEEEFEQLNREEPGKAVYRSRNGFGSGTQSLSIVAEAEDVHEPPLSLLGQMGQLFRKRLRHFSRNYRLLLYVILLPAIFEMFAMWFVSYRLEDDFDTALNFTRYLYPRSTQMLSLESPNNFTERLYQNLKESCSHGVDKEGFDCHEFENSRVAFYWILNSLDEYRGRRYGGIGLNGSGATVWYNNKGYHAMMAWLNDMNTEILRTTMNDSEYKIEAFNEPWKLGFSELTTSSILRQAGDSCMVFILLIAFGLVVAASSVYLVNERIQGEKLQQRLCGVSAGCYWLVAFIWDYLVMVLALLVCLSIILLFGMPVFVDRQQLLGIIVLSLMFSFACVPAVHFLEKLFRDSSISIVSFFCGNLIIPFVTMGIILILGVVGEGATWDSWRHGLNKAFLIFPQHALGDGLLEISKNYMVAQVFRRYDIDSYKHPVLSDLLFRHFLALAILGVIFLTLNLLVECSVLQRLTRFIDCQYKRELRKLGQLKLVSIHSIFKSTMPNNEAVRVENLCLAYHRGKYAVRHVNFAVQRGECFGLLGKNGAGKSTIFKLLTRQMEPNVGEIYFEHPSISYCPQTNPLDPLLTVTECIRFYGRLRGIRDLPRLVNNILDGYELRSYRHILVKNLSGGNRRKLTVAITCCGYTPTVLMDEPTSDMDPVTREFVYRTIDELLKARRAVVLTSHSISEIEHLCQRVAVLKDGQIVSSNSPADLQSQYGGYYGVTCFCPADQQSVLAGMIADQLPNATDLQHHAHSLHFLVKVRPGLSIDDEAPYKMPALSELFVTMRAITSRLERPVRFAINRCQFESVFERILDSCETNDQSVHFGNGGSGVIRALAPEPGSAQSSMDLPAKSPAVSGSLSMGYVHNGFEETST